MKNLNIDCQKIIKKIISFSPRQLEGEKKTADFIINLLKKNQIFAKKQNFFTEIPKNKKVELLCDNKKIACDACSFVSGKIKNKDVFFSSLISSSFFQTTPNLNFNPKCEVISNKNFYFAPSLAVSPKSALEIIKSKKIQGTVEVSLIKHESTNILVGNTNNPKNICFAHYDSVKKGAIDNASGVAIFLKTILENKDLLKNNLFVFSGSEELSNDQPIYWGRGFRAFEEKNSSIMDKAEQIIVMDCVGNGKTEILKDLEIVKLAFPINSIEKHQNKIKIIAGDIDKLMEVYHSDIDDGRGIEEKYLLEAYTILKNLLLF